MQELTRIRSERGWSQQRLSEESGVNKATINQIERGRRSPNVETLERLADALDVGVGDFFPKAQAPLWSDNSPRERRYRPTTREVKTLDLFCTKVERRINSGRMTPSETEIALDAIEGFVAVVAATMSDAMFERFISLGHRLLDAAEELEVRDAAEAKAGATSLEEWKDRRAS
jgi:transcriptional regulator with XRE-family HTH domain